MNQAYTSENMDCSKREVDIAIVYGELEYTLKRMKARFPDRFNCYRLGKSYLDEEFDQVWDAIKSGGHTHTRTELLEVLALGVLVLADCHENNRENEAA